MIRRGITWEKKRVLNEKEREVLNKKKWEAIRWKKERGSEVILINEITRPITLYYNNT